MVDRKKIKVVKRILLTRLCYAFYVLTSDSYIVAVKRKGWIRSNIHNTGKELYDRFKQEIDPTIELSQMEYDTKRIIQDKIDAYNND